MACSRWRVDPIEKQTAICYAVPSESVAHGRKTLADLAPAWIGMELDDLLEDEEALAELPEWFQQLPRGDSPGLY